MKLQGRHLTEGAIRAAGPDPESRKNHIWSAYHPNAFKHSPSFTYVGLDLFGPWSITTRRTRGGQAESKRWAIMLSCLSSRAVHIEVLESMDASSCINALRRFFFFRGPAKQLQSDCGTNFIGACGELEMDKRVQRDLCEQGCSWTFNSPHGSHMGGSWERMIGIARSFCWRNLA